MARDKQKNVANVAALRRRRRLALLEQHGGRCVRCGYAKCPDALVFHHRDPTTKLFNLTAHGLHKSMERVEAEAAKCDLLCANCHAEVHWLGRQKPSLTHLSATRAS